MEFVLIKINSPEWETMWNWVAAHPINQGIDDPSTALNEGESWQYMGSYKQGTKVISSFRHRIHPTTNNLALLNYSHVDFNTESVEREYKLS